LKDRQKAATFPKREVERESYRGSGEKTTARIAADEGGIPLCESVLTNGVLRVEQQTGDSEWGGGGVGASGIPPSVNLCRKGGKSTKTVLAKKNATTRERGDWARNEAGVCQRATLRKY